MVKPSATEKRSKNCIGGEKRLYKRSAYRGKFPDREERINRTVASIFFGTV